MPNIPVGGQAYPQRKLIIALNTKHTIIYAGTDQPCMPVVNLVGHFSASDTYILCIEYNTRLHFPHVVHRLVYPCLEAQWLFGMPTARAPIIEIAAYRITFFR
jgi:hypothetical protein